MNRPLQFLCLFDVSFNILKPYAYSDFVEMRQKRSLQK